MRMRLSSILLGSMLVTILMLTLPQQAYAVQSTISDVSGPCGAIHATVTLVHTTDDGNGEDRFWFRVFDGDTITLLAQIETSVARAASPVTRQFGPVEGTATTGLYRLEVWDIDGEGKPLRQIEQVYYQCATSASWRPTEGFEQDPDIPEIVCSASVPVYSVNLAPEAGWVMVVWSYGHLQTDDEFLVGVIPVSQGDRLYETDIPAPCGVYVRLYYQRASTGEKAFLRSQYHPNDDYGTPARDKVIAPWYTTKFPSP